MTEVSLRPATIADAPRLAELVDAAYAHFVERIGGRPRPMTLDYDTVVRTSRVTVAECGGEIVGLIVLEPADQLLVIDNVAVDPAHQGTGVGRALLEHAEATARTEGLGEIGLFTHELMTENQALYRRIGYIEFERRQRGPARVVHMRKSLA